MIIIKLIQYWVVNYTRFNFITGAPCSHIKHKLPPNIYVIEQCKCYSTWHHTHVWFIYEHTVINIFIIIVYYIYKQITLSFKYLWMHYFAFFYSKVPVSHTCVCFNRVCFLNGKMRAEFDANFLSLNWILILHFEMTSYTIT